MQLVVARGLSCVTLLRSKIVGGFLRRAASLEVRSGCAPTESDRAFALTAACCRWPFDIEAVRTTAADVIDWRLFAKTARRHRVIGLVHQAAQRTGLPLPAGIADRLAEEARQIAREGLAHAQECVRLQRLYDRAGIPVRFLKGVALAQAAYGTVTMKHARDIDLLVPPAHVRAALELLLQDGYSLRQPGSMMTPAQVRALVVYGSQAELDRDDGKTRLELHWRLSVNARLPHGIDPFAEAATTALPGVGGLNVLTPHDEFIYLCVHGAGHAWSRLKWLADLNARLCAFDADRIASLCHSAHAHGAGLCAGQALLLCDRLLGRELPDELRAALNADARIGRLLTLAERRMRAADPAGATGWHAARTFRNVIDPFRLGRGPRFLAAQMRQVLIGPGDPIRLPLPRSLLFLYPLMRIPFWLWRQLRRRGKRPVQAAHRR